ncbi:MAG: ATP-dependent RNA helicase HrpA [Pseudomonadota bacterium]|nr:ATP-dependent RNA helicase HrpA [Pseudomonadota bacterium]
MQSNAAIDRLLIELGEGMIADYAPVARSIDRLRRKGASAAEIERVSRVVAASRERALRRAARIPPIDYPPELPVSARRHDIAQALRAHQTIIVCGETGSGKTTQLPKICLEHGRGVRGLIGHTQPRRIAARSVAARIAQELGTPAGDIVGYKVRFSDQTRRDAYIKLMTDGILLAETQSDRLLAAYDTIIIDEAHERSLNVDFLLGYLKQLLPRRPDLKLIITSATLDADRFARHFGDGTTSAPVIDVEGRMFPVEVRYRPLGAGDDPAGQDEVDDEEALEEAIVSTAEDIWREGPGDILVFLPGEREIRETAELLSRDLARRPYASSLEILPLFARLSVEQQQQVFAPSRGRRIVLATNVAETSLTVPGIRYVIDSGLARIKRYSLRNKVTLLQIEKVSQAAANQRAGRCGRVAAGVCVRLYEAADFAARPRYTEPEILRSSLAAVILRMASLDLGEVASFPFPEPPSPRAVADGYQLLQELGAVDAHLALTPLGRELAKLPVDPRIGRIILAAKEAGCLAEILVIASAMAVPDPRDRPMEKRQAADQAHLRFRDDRSDYLSLIALWQFFTDALAETLPHRRLVERCRAHFVSYLRLREWRDLHRQLSDQVAELGWKWNDALPAAVDAARYATIHRALLEGLLSNIGTKADAVSSEYLGARGIRFMLHPGSGLAKKPPKWVLAAELTETTRLYARGAASVDPEWIEQVAGDRVDRTYFDPHWDAARGEVVGAERVSLYGLTLVPRRRVSYGRVDPASAHEVFLREALVAGGWTPQPARAAAARSPSRDSTGSSAQMTAKTSFFDHNRKLVEDIAELEHKTRRQDVLVDDETIYAFYAARIPADICSAASFERWRRDAERDQPRLLFMTREELMRHGASDVTEVLYPEHLEMAGVRLALKYRFAPDHPLDGLTLTVPLALLNQVESTRLSWLVPGMVREKLTWYLKALPKAWRQRLTPMPELVTAFLQASAATGPPAQSGDTADVTELSEVLRAFCAERLGATLPADVWKGAELPPHLCVNVRVVDANGRELGSGRDLPALKAQFGEAAQLSFSAADPEFERADIRTWDFGDLPQSLTVDREGRRLTGYPALVEQGESVSLKLLDTQRAAEVSTRAALLRLLRRQFKDALQRWEKQPPGFAQAALMLKTAIPTDALLSDTMAAICDRAFIGDDALPRSEIAYAEQVKRARVRLPAVAEGAFRLLGTIAVEYHALSQRLAALPGAQARLGTDLRAQRDALVYPGFLCATPWSQLVHLPRYLKALERRLAKYSENPARDAKDAHAVADFWHRYLQRRYANAAAGNADPDLEAFRWQIEELKVSLFAQELRTPQPVSYKRLEKAWTDLCRR